MNPKLPPIIGAKSREAVASAGQTPQSDCGDAPTYRFSTWSTLLKDTFTKWSADKAPRLGAALSYYMCSRLRLYSS